MNDDHVGRGKCGGRGVVRGLSQPNMSLVMSRATLLVVVEWSVSLISASRRPIMELQKSY